MSSYNEVERMILLKKFETDSVEPNILSPLTTIFYPDDQISSYQQNTISSTTPMPGKQPPSRNVTFLGIGTEENIPTWHPTNHKRHYSKVYNNKINLEANRGFETTKSIFDNQTPKKRTFFTDDDDFDYEDSYRNVNSIQDILNQNGNENENFSDGAIPFSRRMKVEGIYRSGKKKGRDHLSEMEQSGQQSSVYEENIQKNDPFSKFKPSKPGDVNLLAADLIQYKQFTHHTPRPLTTPMTLNNFYEDYYGSQDPNIIFHQIIAANKKNRDASMRNGRFERPIETNKPFSLMLDVYPMPGETIFDSKQAATTSSTRVTSYNQHRRPFYPINSHTINHNLHYNKDNSFYNHMKFPQIQQYPYHRMPYDGFYRNYIANRMNTNTYRSLLKPSLPLPIDPPTENGPSQITVHLNLYPDRKKQQTRNVEIIKTENTTPVAMTDNQMLWKRLEHLNTTKSDDPIDDVRPSRHTYIPPFSAIKINSLQHSFDVNDLNSLQQSETTEKSMEYNMFAFDSKKLVSNIKEIKPTTNSIISSSSYFDEISRTITTEQASTLSSHFDSTMSSSMYTTSSPSSPSSSSNQFPFFGNNIPCKPTAVTDQLNESESVQPTNIYDSTIRFPDQ